MDGISTLKRRRSHSFTDDSYSSYSHTELVYPSPVPLLTDHQRIVINEAASIIQVPPGELLCFGPQQFNAYVLDRAAQILGTSSQTLIETSYNSRPHQKRPRHSVDISLPNMSPKYRFSYSDQGPEKGPLSQNLIAQGNVQEERRSFFSMPLTDGTSFLGSTASGVAECLASLSSCQPSSSRDAPIEYEAVLTTVSRTPTIQSETSQYVESRPFQGVGVAVNTAPVTEAYHDGFHAQPENWLSDETTGATFMQSYPALQPTLPTSAGPIQNPPLTRVQPNTHLVNMFYPNEQIPTNSFPKNEADDMVSINSIPPTTLPVEMAHVPGPQLQGYLGDVHGGAGFPQSPNTVVTEVQYTMAPPKLIPTTVPFEPSNTVHPPQAHRSVPIPTTSLEVGIPHSMEAVPYPTSVVPQYTTPIPIAAAEHRASHHEQSQVAITPYIGETNFEMSVRPHQRPPPARRGPFKDEADRKKTAQTRRDGCCIRCRMQRIRCVAQEIDTKGECMSCMNKTNRTWRLPCLRLKVVDVILSKTTQVKGHEWTLRWKENTVLDDVGHWASSETRIVRISEGYTHEFVELRVRKFVPQDGDSLERSWVAPNGETRSVQIPPYAVIEPEAIAPQYSAYIKRGLVACCENVLADKKDTILWPTYWVALNLTHKQNHLSENQLRLLTKTLDLWMTVRLTTRSFEIVGDETLDMPANILDETSPSHGKIPIPPVMGAQLDSVLIHEIQHTLRHGVLQGLDELIKDNKTMNWFTLYLVMFILLHNAALVIKHDASYARKHGLKRRFAREDKVQQYYMGAITILAYFHYCNKGVFPFTESAREQDVRILANLDENTMGFVQYTRRYAIDNKARWQAMRDANDYEDEFYFISQLYEVNWLPRKMIL